MRFISLLAATLLCFTAGSANASLIFLGPDSLAGQGIGAVTTTLTVQQAARATTESGCVSAGVGGATIEGVCPGNGPNGGNAFTGGDEGPGTTPVSAAVLGLTDFADLRIAFGAAEPSGDGITIDNLALTLWNPADGSLLGAFYIEDPEVFADTNPGVGILDGFFGLDVDQAADANLLLAAFPNLFLGLAANLSGTGGAAETFSFGVAGDLEAVPEPATLALLGAGLAGLGWLSRRRSR